LRPARRAVNYRSPPPGETARPTTGPEVAMARVLVVDSCHRRSCRLAAALAD